jgi:protease PrsW
MSPRLPRPVLDSARFGRTPVLFLFGLAACCLIAIIALVIVVMQRGPAPALVGLLLGVLPIPLLVALVLYLDRLEPEPRALLAAIFGAGAGIAVITALLGRALHTGVITTPDLEPHASVATAVSVGAAIGGALVAETLNGLVLVALLASRGTEIDGVEDGVVYGSMVGLGFALVANVYAYAVAWGSGAGALAEEFQRRGIFGPVFQALFTSLIGLGVAYAAARPAVPGRYLGIFVGWVAAVALDALWNHSEGKGVAGTGLLVTYAILLAAVLALVIAVIADRQRVVRIIISFLPDFEHPEVVTEQDIRMLASLRMRRRGRQWARLSLGIAGRQAMTQYQLAATELAMACRRKSLGQTTEDTYARHRDDSLTLMRAAAEMIRRQEQLNPPPWIAPESPSVFVTYRPDPDPPKWPTSRLAPDHPSPTP